MNRYPQYPRRFRADLTGLWDFEFIPQNTATLPDLVPSNVTYTEKEVVPGCFDAAGTHAGHRGIGVYRTSVQIPHDGKYRLELGGLMLMGRIFWDGKEIGFDPYPYSGAAYEFEADSGSHELVIAVENRVNTPYDPLFQANYAFHTYAGILRSVVLYDLPQNHLGRTSVTTLDVRSGLVRLDIEVPCASDGELLAMTVQFDNGSAVTRNMVAENGVCSAEFTLPDPAPWTPEHPALHTVRLILPDCSDELVERFGLRTIEAKNAKLYLNGEELILHGFNRHDSHPEFGNAVPPALMLADLQLLRSMNCNFIRGCHYPQSQEFLDMCDEFGILVWEEAIASGNTKDDLAYEVFRQRQLDQTSMMIRNSRNHPSVIFWGFLNEVDSRLPEARDFMAEMVQNIKSFDTSRPVTYASMYIGRGDICLDLVDVISCNTYPGWYETYVYEENSHTHIGPRFDEVVKAVSTPELKDKPLIISELGAAAIYGCRERSRIPWSEEFQADELEETCRQLKLHPRFCGVAFWQFADTRSYMRGGSSQARGFNNKGVLDEYRREKLAADVVRRAFAEYKNDHAKLCFTGDIMCQKELTAACTKADGTLDYGDIFRRIAPYFKDSDYCVGNLETCFAGEQAAFSHELYSFNTPDAFAHTVSEAGFQFVSTANNHCLDRGTAGLFRTLNVLDQAGLEHHGTFRTQEEHDKSVVRYINGIKVAFISSTYGTNAFANHTFLKPEEAFAVNLSMPQETLPGSVHLLNSMEQIAADVATLPDGESPEFAEQRKAIEQARVDGAEYVICLMHSGGQYNSEPDACTEKLVNALLSYGADMIVGNHPHIIQKYAVYNGKPVFYCLGNVVSTPSLSPEQLKHPRHVNSIAVKPVLTRVDGKVRMTAGTFSVLRSVQLPDNVSCVTPLYDLIAASADPAEKAFLAEELRWSVRTFLHLPENAEVELKSEYDLPIK